MEETPKPRIAVLRDAAPAGVPDGCSRCQVCGTKIGAGLTHCLRCRSARAAAGGALAPAPRRRASPLPLLAAVLIAGGAAAAWVAGRRAPHPDPDPAPVAAVVADEPAARPVAAHRRAATPAAARPVPARTPPVARREPPPRPSTRPVKLTAKCRACGGSGRMRNGSATRTCPICRGSPDKVRWVSPTHAFCPSCAGFGRIMEMRDGARRPADCPKCRGCGLIKK